MNCPRCGYALPERGTFCPKCGAPAAALHARPAQDLSGASVTGCSQPRSDTVKTVLSVFLCVSLFAVGFLASVIGAVRLASAQKGVVAILCFWSGARIGAGWTAYRDALSFGSLTGLCLLGLLFIELLLIVHRKRIRSVFSFVGMTCLLLGLLLALSACAVLVWIVSLRKQYLETVAAPAVHWLLTIAGAVYIFGLILYVAYRRSCRTSEKWKYAGN